MTPTCLLMLLFTFYDNLLAFWLHTHTHWIDARVYMLYYIYIYTFNKNPPHRIWNAAIYFYSYSRGIIIYLYMHTEFWSCKWVHWQHNNTKCEHNMYMYTYIPIIAYTIYYILLRYKTYIRSYNWYKTLVIRCGHKDELRMWYRYLWHDIYKLPHTRYARVSR